MFPAPTTIATSTSRSRSSAISPAIFSTSWRSRPYSLSPIRASPESFSRTRRNAGLPLWLSGNGVALVFEDFELVFLERLGDRLARVVDPLLVGQDDLAVEALREHALDDLLAVLLGPGVHLRELVQDLELGRQILRRDLVSVRVQRCGKRDVHRQEAPDLRGPSGSHEHPDLVRGRVDVGGKRFVVALLFEARCTRDDNVLAELAYELLPLVFEVVDRVGALTLDGVEHCLGEGAELVVVGDGLGLAADGDERADVVGDSGEHDSLGRLTTGALSGLSHAALTQEPLGGVHVAFGLLECPLRVHHPRAGLVAELLDERCPNLSHRSVPPSLRSRRRFPPAP